MPQWGRDDKAVTANSTTTKESTTGAPMMVSGLVKGGTGVAGANAHYGNTSAGSRASIDSALFGNTTHGAFIANMAVGIFGADPTETSVATGGLSTTLVLFPGSGYSANATCTLTVTNGGTLGVVNAHANSSGRIDSLLVQTAGSLYVTNPTLAVAAPSALTFSGNSTNVSTSTDLINTAQAAFLQANDAVLYLVGAGNTAITPLVNNTTYYVSFANATHLALSTTKGGANLDITAVGTGAQAGHSLTGETASGVVTVSGGKNKGVAHAGWVVRREGSGGRAGRVHYETLVAMGSLGQTDAKYGTAAGTADASDDTILPDS